MSRQHINAYRKTLAEQHRVTGSLNERVLRKAFGDLLERMGRSHDLVFTNEWEGRGPRGNQIAVDGALVPAILRKPFGYWEAKDSKDDLDREIRLKIDRGYPDDNIIYEDTRTAILRQDGREAMRADLADDDALLALLSRFFAYERPELTEFRAASIKFRADLPQVLDALRMAIGEAEARSSDFARALKEFLDHAREAINPIVSADDVREMLIQHILTEEIFASVFDNAQYHRENNVARRLGALEAKFFTGALRHATTELLRPYYGAIKHAASALADRREKQTFVKKLYEDFYKVYNPQAADRLGVVYTPGEIVRFMIRGAEWLTEKHWGKTLADEGVEILDPATGTGTFIVELIEHMEGSAPDKLRAKYTRELHANEVAILPYYVANLNIEATYASIAGQYAEFPGLVFVDTLDNTAGLGIYKGYTADMFGSFADENLERVKRQNAAKLSVIIGNPPYNAWQSDYNTRNPNRPYKRVDDRIGRTYRAKSKAQNTNSLSDMYVRFWRWASDRMREDGVIAMVTNRNFIEKVAFDGFRLSVAEEFAECWLMDLGGDVRANPKISGTKHNVFGIQTGVTIAFFVRKKGAKGFKLFYARRPEDETAREKLAFLASIEDFDRWQVAPLKSDAKGNWLSSDHPGWAAYLPLADPTKGIEDDIGHNVEHAADAGVEAIFRLSSNGVVTQRDDWMWAHAPSALAAKAKLLIKGYEKDREEFRQIRRAVLRFDNGDVSPQAEAARLRMREWKPSSKIKWDADLDRTVRSLKPIKYEKGRHLEALFRPFGKAWLYFDGRLNGRVYRLPWLYRNNEPNPGVVVSDKGWRSQFAALATDTLPDAHAIASIDRYFVVTRYRYTKSGERVDNITDWALRQFRERYAKSSPERGGGAASRGDAVTEGAHLSAGAGGERGPLHHSAAPNGPPPHAGEDLEITKDDIFAYCYAALHDSVFREVHAADLRREFPRIPLHDDFWRWRDWGQALLDLHIGYEQAKPWPVKRVDTPAKAKPVPKLKSDATRGAVVVDSETQLTGIPSEAWDYRLGNRSAIDWVLDQHKEKRPRDPTVAAKFNTYRFADHKETMIKLLARVVRVSVETVKIVAEMRAEREKVDAGSGPA